MNIISKTSEVGVCHIANRQWEGRNLKIITAQITQKEHCNLYMDQECWEVLKYNSA